MRQALAEARTQEAPGWNCSRSASCADAMTRPLKTDRHWRHSSINFLKQAIRTAVKNARALVSKKKPRRNQRATVN